MNGALVTHTPEHLAARGIYACIAMPAENSELKLEYSVMVTRSTPLLLMSWLLASPGNWQEFMGSAKWRVPYLPQGRISATCANPVLRNDRKCKCGFIFHKINSKAMHWSMLESMKTFLKFTKIKLLIDSCDSVRTRTTRMPTFWDTPCLPMITHTSDSHQIPSENKTKSKLHI